MTNKTIVLTNEQLHQAAEIISALTHGKLERIPSRYSWLEEIIELPQVQDYYATGFNYLSTNAKEFEGTYHCKWMYTDVALKMPNFLYSIVNKAITNYVLREWSWKAAYITATSPMLDKEIPDVEELLGWICECGDEAYDPGMGCLACFTGVRDQVCISCGCYNEDGECDDCNDQWREQASEGPYGGAFRDEMDYINWREGSGFVKY